ncbi:uncharacterized protein MKZ38_004680 [Zalerion maritima]|uniref:Kinesin motor domain-containing protein n=1 Tax=Zalerion maritima TaxID=339359 RepID=A0AAD5RKZ9_9PEZI|nr:uncharacterized protein MKZ38_004680 [Zalerion maritima]
MAPRSEGGASSISVAVRVRPFTIQEAAQIPKTDDGQKFLGDGSLAGHPTPKLNQKGIRSVVKVVDDRCLVFDPPEDNPVQKFSRSVIKQQPKKTKDTVFAFDRVFDDNSTQPEVYEGTTKNLLDSVLDGYNATVFAYGATGCGKTHTITGTPQQPGIIWMTMQELFEKIHERSEDKVTELTLSYLEIYNENIRDLLVPGGSKANLILREDSQQTVSVAGLTSHRPKDVQEVMDMIVAGNEYRTVSPTAANATSSRSHAVLQINVAQKDRSSSVSEPHTMATLSIIDLAGSERATATKNDGARLKEGANINKSLLALGSCINALCDAKRSKHVPYRDSKLTRLLKFSLGGNCKTVMIVCISPSSGHFDETQNTLRYANRAKNIQTKVTKNVFNVNRHVKDFLVKIDEQLAIINQLKAEKKDAEKLFFAKFQKQLDKKDSITREGISRIRTSYENCAAERQDMINMMKQLKTVERRIGLLSGWMGAFDALCDNRDGEDNMPSPLMEMRKTALGVLSEFENSRQYLHRKIETNKWDRALNSALSNSVGQLPEEDQRHSPEASNLRREADLLRERFESAALREVSEHEKSADASMMQALLTSQFEMLASLSDTLEMDEEDAVRHAKDIINRLLKTGYAASSNVVKPDGRVMPLEQFAPTRRGTPKRKRPSLMYKENARAIPSLSLAPNPTIASLQEEETHGSPSKPSPRRLIVNSPRKRVSFNQARKSKGPKRSVRWRDDESEEGTLADYAKTPTKRNSSPPQPSPEKDKETEMPPAPALPTHLETIVEPSEDSTMDSIEAPESVSMSLPKPDRFKAGFLSKSRPLQNGSPNVPLPPSMTVNLSDPDSPLVLNRSLRDVSPSFAMSNLSPNNIRSRIPSPKLSLGVDENHPPSASGSDSDSSFSNAKLRNALAAKRNHRVSSIGLASSGKRVSSMGSNSGGSGLASASNGISRNRRGSAERRRSPPITCSPPETHSRSAGHGFNSGEARRMNLGGSVRGVGGSPGERRDRDGTRRVTITGLNGSGPKRTNVIWR